MPCAPPVTTAILFRSFMGHSRCRTSSAQRRLPRCGAREELAAVAQAFLVDAVTDSLRNMPLHRHFERAEVVGGEEQRLRRGQVVAIAVDEQDWRLRLDLG